MMLDLAWAVDDFVSSFGEIGSHIYDDTGRSPDAQAQKEGQDAADRQRESPWISRWYFLEDTQYLQR